MQVRLYRCVEEVVRSKAVSCECPFSNRNIPLRQHSEGVSRKKKVQKERGMVHKM